MRLRGAWRRRSLEPPKKLPVQQKQIVHRTNNYDDSVKAGNRDKRATWKEERRVRREMQDAQEEGEQNEWAEAQALQNEEDRWQELGEEEGELVRDTEEDEPNQPQGPSPAARPGFLRKPAPPTPPKTPGEEPTKTPTPTPTRKKKAFKRRKERAKEGRKPAKKATKQRRKPIGDHGLCRESESRRARLTSGSRLR